MHDLNSKNPTIEEKRDGYKVRDGLQRLLKNGEHVFRSFMEELRSPLFFNKEELIILNANNGESRKAMFKGLTVSVQEATKILNVFQRDVGETKRILSKIKLLQEKRPIVLKEEKDVNSYKEELEELQQLFDSTAGKENSDSQLISSTNILKAFWGVDGARKVLKKEMVKFIIRIVKACKNLQDVEKRLTENNKIAKQLLRKFIFNLRDCQEKETPSVIIYHEDGENNEVIKELRELFDAVTGKPESGKKAFKAAFAYNTGLSNAHGSAIDLDSLISDLLCA